MIRYRLMPPSTSSFARIKNELFVWLDADYQDQLGRLQFEGPAPIVAEVRRALSNAPGYRESKMNVDGLVMPLDLRTAMGSNVMRPFQPELVEGANVLTSPSPPTLTTEELTVEFASRFATWVVTNLPGPVKVRSYAWEHLVRGLQGTLFEWSFWRPKYPSEEMAASALAVPLREALAHETARLKNVYERHPIDQRLVPPSLTPEEAQQVANVFVEALDTAAPGDDGAATLIVRLHEQLLALGLMSRRET
ncbi:hypothetical protein [Myxococcus sp. AB056]|uniref:hypothetical protein n=1 Tax=Myxococcus sp. AB056 TaxID=2562792 RepID=UPI001146737D|nr:hypothetical protein [Myxococcus sp. AB056]